MQLQVKGRNLEVSDSIRSYAERKLSKLDKQVHELTRWNATRPSPRTRLPRRRSG